jgi:ubiquinone/menaquinone biosynthesis C-methylase UbiE
MNYTGVDLSKGMLKVARESFPQAEFHRMDVANLDFRANTFDVVWASAILLHLDSKDLEKTLGEIKRVLKPEGLVLISLEKRGKGRQKKEMKNSQKGKNQVSRFFHLFKRKEFQEVLITNNFHILQTGQKSEESGEKDWLYFIAKV